MTEDTDTQDLVKALDSVANAAPGSIGNPVSTPSTSVPSTPATSIAIGGSVDNPFPEITPSPSMQSSGAVTVGQPGSLPLPNDLPSPTSTAAVSTPISVDDTVVDTAALDSIKQNALGELRPLVDKLNVSAEEKFDTYLLLIRSTDDKRLIAPAHEAAKAIEDETKRAEALLNIIKEIDYLSRQNGE